jgi:PAS domain S-box-containing protein
VFDNEPTAHAGGAAVQRFELPVANRRWLVEVTPHPQPWWQAADASTLTLLVAGLVCAASLAALTAGLARARQDAEARVRDGLRQLEDDKTQLERSETRLRLLFEHSLDAVLTTRPGGGVVAANPAACELFGRTHAELIRARANDIADTGDARLSALLAQRSATGRTRGLARLRRGDGSTFEAEISSMTYQDIDGSPLASVVVRDLSAGLQAAAQRELLEGQLRHAQKMQAVGTLAGGIAHDFNNVLAIVMGGAALLDGELPAGDPAHAHLDRIRQAALRARTLVQQLMTFSRPTTEGLWAQPLQPLVQEAMALLRATLPTTVELKLEMADAPIHVVTEATQVQQVLINLCNNAAQAMPDSKGHITVALDATAPPDGGPRWAHLSVRDDGKGMDTAVRERIFEPFFTTKGAGQGTGLGLAMVHGIVTAHGGSVEVSSAPGRGSLFEVWLPVVGAPEDAPRTQPRPAVPARGRGERLMYVDDDEVLRLTVCALLTQLGYRAEAQADPVHALAALAAAPADVALVITDFNMPQMSGLDVACAAQQLRADLPVLIVSGHVTEALHAAVEQLDHVDLLRKEFMAEQLGECVAALLAAEHVG